MSCFLGAYLGWGSVPVPGPALRGKAVATVWGFLSGSGASWRPGRRSLHRRLLLVVVESLRLPPGMVPILALSCQSSRRTLSFGSTNRSWTRRRWESVYSATCLALPGRWQTLWSLMRWLVSGVWRIWWVPSKLTFPHTWRLAFLGLLREPCTAHHVGTRSRCRSTWSGWRGHSICWRRRTWNSLR